MSTPDATDRIYRLLPQVIQDSDAFAGRPLQALMRVLNAQADIVEEDIAALLDNWFVETCDDWVLPYIGELIGYRLVPENSLPDPGGSARDRQRLQAIVPRAEVANTIRFRRRKGTLLVLEELAQAVAGWPARAVELRERIASAWHSRFPDRARGRAIDMRDGDLLDRGFGPFDGTSRRPDLRRLASTHTRGRGSLPAVALWLWRTKVQVIDRGETRGLGHGGHDNRHLERFTVDPLGIDRPLLTQPEPLPERTEPAGEREVPAPIRRRALHDHLEHYYGRAKSIQLWWSHHHTDRREEIPLTEVVAADLTHWEASLYPEHELLDETLCSPCAAIDPELGRILFRRNHSENDPIIWASFQCGFTADIGGGSYFRVPFDAPAGVERWYVRRTIAIEVSREPDGKETEIPTGIRPDGTGVFDSLADALHHWNEVGKTATTPRHVLIEIEDDAVHHLGVRDGNSVFPTEIKPGELLAIRAAAQRRPVIRPVGERSGQIWKIKRTVPAPPGPDEPSGTFILDGILLADFALTIDGALKDVHVNDCTVVAEHLGQGKALELDHLAGCLSIQRSIIAGSIHVDPKGWQPEAFCKRPGQAESAATPRVPLLMYLSDSILDADKCDEKLSLAGARQKGEAHHPPAFVELHLARCTVFGGIRAYTLILAEDSIFSDRLEVANTSLGCMRFCSIDARDALQTMSPTPPRYDCQPDQAIQRFADEVAPRQETDAQIARSVSPRFASVRFGDFTHARLALDCPVEVRRGASDESEMGAFHDLYQPQREALLKARVAEYTLAGMDAQFQFAD